MWLVLAGRREGCKQVENISGEGTTSEWDSQRGRALGRDNVSLIKKNLRTVVNEGRVQGVGCC